jgi:hypothetical protein
MRLSSLTLPFAVLLLILSPACGGAGGGGLGPVTTASMPPVGAMDGFIDNNGLVETTGWLGGILVGDSSLDNTAQGFLTFDIAALPNGADVVEATLTVRQFSTSGTPYPILGAVLIDHVDIGAGLDASDWGTPALDGNFDAVSQNGATGALSVDVTDQIQADVAAGRVRSSFRLGFTALTDNDGNQDTAHFQDSEDTEGSGVLPTLIVRYRP